MPGKDADKTILALTKIATATSDRPPMIAEMLNHLGVRTFAEIGVWKGNFAKHLLAECSEITKYHMIDPWRTLDDWDKPLNETPDFEAVYQTAMVNTEFAKSRIKVHRGTTLEVVDDIKKASLDACYIDGDHSLRGVMIDIIALYDKVKPEGVIFGDDLAKNPWQHGPNYEPTLVFPAVVHVAEAMGDPFVTLPGGQFAIVKNRERAFKYFDFAGGYSDQSIKAHFKRGAGRLK